MKHKINPLVDCVFKAVLGSEENKNLLIHFLNAVMNPPAGHRIESVDLINPYNEKEFLSDKLTIVDIKAKDQSGCMFQTEVQALVYPVLPSRMIYTWADIYGSQLKQGQPYSDLKSVNSIWLLGENLFSDRIYHHCFAFADIANDLVITEPGEIHTLELKKWRADGINDDLNLWSWFFQPSEHLDTDQLPPFIAANPIMRQAMATVEQFSEKEKDYFRYQARMNYLREQKELERLRYQQEMEIKEQEKELEKQKNQLDEQKNQLDEQKNQLDEKDKALEEMYKVIKQLKQKLGKGDR